MSEQTTVAKAPPAAPKKARSKLVRVANLRELPSPVETPDGLRFSLTVTTMNFKQEDWPCTQTVYSWARNTQPNYKVRSEWVLTIDTDTGLITHVTEARPRENLQGFTKVEEGKEPSKYVIVSLFPDGSSAVTGTVPERVSEAIVQEIQNSILDFPDSIHANIKVGRFIVHKKVEQMGTTDVYVDPMPKD